MIAVVQRVKRAAVRVDGRVTGECGRGLAILLGVSRDDDETDALLLAGKIAKLRIFSDSADKMNLSVTDVGGGAVIVSQFTLLANYIHGNRPDYLAAAEPTVAKALYERFAELFEQASSIKAGMGVFGAHMEYEIINDGPVTIVMDSKKLKRK